ncbi:MAG: methylmalonyl Co-A mutase-associated GTPase MeaB [Pseudomonadota bacterium]
MADTDVSAKDTNAATAPDIGDLKTGNRRSLARALTLCETAGPELTALMERLEGALSGVKVLGVTGPPGAGKSTLVNALLSQFRMAEPAKPVAVIAIDPSSPVSGGAILGDRVRMTRATDDTGVFVRSLSASGHLGGMVPAVARMIDVFDAADYGTVIIETVGTGQSEVDVARVADVTLVIAAPGLGDDIQAMKSGLLEVADVIAVNKCDRPGADQTRQQLSGAMSLRTGPSVPVLAVSGATGQGITELAHALDATLQAQEDIGPATRRTARAKYLLHRDSIRLVEALVGPAEEIALDLLNGRCNTQDALTRLLEQQTMPRDVD